MSLQWNKIFLIYLNLLLVSCARNSSLTFVVDDTASMYDDIDQLMQASAANLHLLESEKASEIADVVLVTFNDPDVKLREKTANPDTFLEALRKIKVDNGGDCPEYSLSGIEKALEESRPNSYLYVLTDASAKDYDRVNTVISLCERKQSQVVFVLTGACYDDRKILYKVYFKIAKACNGQVFRVPKKEVKDVLETVKVAIKGPKTVVTSKVLPPSVAWCAVPFTVDDVTEYVVVSTSGRNIDLLISDSEQNRDNKMPVDKILWISSGKVVKFVAPEPGTYYAWVNGDTDMSVIVHARTDISINHGFSSVPLMSLEGTTKLPTKGEELQLSIAVEDPSSIVDLKSAEVLNMTEQVITNLPLNKVNGNYYNSEKMVFPSDAFKIQVTGINKMTGKVIKRLTKTNIDPQDPTETGKIPASN